MALSRNFGYRGSPGDTDLLLFAGRTIDVPSSFMGGAQDWGVYQSPGALDRLEKKRGAPRSVAPVAKPIAPLVRTA